MDLSPARVSAAYAIALDACDGDPERARRFLLAGIELARLKEQAATSPAPPEVGHLRLRLANYVCAS